MKVCSVCNEINNEVEGKYCVFCGSKLIEKEEKSKKVSRKESIRLEENNDSEKSVRILKRVLIAIIVILLG